MSNVFKSHSICLDHQSRFMLQHKMRFKVESDDSGDDSGIALQATKPVECLIEMAKRDADAIRNNAQGEAHEIIAQATSEAQRIKEQAKEAGFQEGFQEGFQAGFQKGLEEAQKRFLAEIDEAQRLKEEIIRERESLYQQFERDLVALAVDIAKRAIYDRLEADDEVLAQVVESTLRKIQGKVKVQLKVSKHDYRRISILKERVLSKLHHIESMDIIEDDFLSPGSCVVDTGRGTIDGSVDVRLREIEAVMVGH